MPYHLIRDSVSPDTVEALQELLKAAQTGEAIGIVFAVMLRRQRYIVNTAGEARRSPTLARGMVAALDDELRALVHAGSFEESR